MDVDRPISQDEVDMLYTLARKAGIFREALAKQNLPDNLVDQLVRDWHLFQLQIQYPSSAHRLAVSEVIRLLGRPVS